jgi:hypothetical protein
MSLMFQHVASRRAASIVPFVVPSLCHDRHQATTAHRGCVMGFNNNRFWPVLVHHHCQIVVLLSGTIHSHPNRAAPLSWYWWYSQAYCLARAMAPRGVFLVLVDPTVCVLVPARIGTGRRDQCCGRRAHLSAIPRIVQKC